jgi:O-antigen/teichoic acid export membrane protein
MIAARARSLGLVGLSIVVSGVLVNTYLAIVARELPAAEYAHFGAFWSVALVVGYGVFLPIEQETARLQQTPGRPGRTLRSTTVTALGMACVQLLVLAAGASLLVRPFGGSWATVCALGALCLVSAGQFVVRGALIGLDRMRHYALLTVCDAMLRVVLAVTVALLVARPGSSEFAWTLVGAIALAHAPTLYALLRRRVRPGTVPPLGPGVVTPQRVARSVAPLLLGSLCAQVLLNGPPVLVPALASSATEATLAGQFVAAFTLTRIPLFLAVPLQTALLPTLTALLHTGERLALRRVMARLGLGVLGLGVVAVALGATAGPWLVRLIFGEQYVLGGGHMALLALGVAGYVGLVIVTQVLVAAARHRDVAWSWSSGVLAGAAVAAAVPGLLLRAELGFLAGTLVAWVVSASLVLTRRPDQEPQVAGV